MLPFLDVVNHKKEMTPLRTNSPLSLPLLKVTSSFAEVATSLHSATFLHPSGVRHPRPASPAEGSPRAANEQRHCDMTRVAILFVLWCLALPPALGSVRVNEVSDKGSAGVCAGEDWVELFNPGSAAVNLSGYKLHDDKGPGDDLAFTFPPADVIGAGSYLLLCTKAASRPAFKIGGDDTVTLLDAAGNVVSTSGQLQDLGEVNMTWAYASESGNFQYTNRPTPGASNVISQDWPKVRARLVQQDVDGEDFFSSTGTFGAVVDVHLTMVY